MNIEPLAPSNFAAFEELFTTSSSSCFCRYWHFEGNKNDWLARCAHDAEKNRAEQAALVLAEDPRARGLLALEVGRAVGWMKLASRAHLPKLRRLPVYRSIDLGPDDGVYAVACLLVHPDWRRRGVAKALLVEAERQVQAWGGSTIEAYPRRAGAPIHAEEAWMGPESLYQGAGFAPAHDDGPYPVLRKALR